MIGPQNTRQPHGVNSIDLGLSMLKLEFSRRFRLGDLQRLPVVSGRHALRSVALSPGSPRYPMLLAIDRAPTLEQALLLGWWAGVVETAGGFYWLIDVMRRFAGISLVGRRRWYSCFSAPRARSFFLLFTAIVRRIRKRAPRAHDPARTARHGELRMLVPQIFPCGQWIIPGLASARDPDRRTHRPPRRHRRC